MKWTKFMNNLKNNVKIFDDIINFHEEFIQSCIKESLILENEFWKLFSHLNNLCIQFHLHMMKNMIKLRDSSLRMEEEDMYDPEEGAGGFCRKRNEKLNQDAENFKKHLENKKMTDLSKRIDDMFNTN